MPETTNIPELLERLETLEKSNRRFKRLGAVFLLLIVSAFLMDQTSPSPTVEAGRFVLKDASGAERATLGFYNEGPRLALKDEVGRVRLDLLVASDGPYARLWDANWSGKKLTRSER